MPAALAGLVAVACDARARVVSNRNTSLPLAGATVVARLENGLSWFATTDTFGQFILTSMPIGATAHVHVERTNFAQPAHIKA